MYDHFGVGEFEFKDDPLFVNISTTFKEYSISKLHPSGKRLFLISGVAKRVLFHDVTIFITQICKVRFSPQREKMNTGIRGRKDARELFAE